MNTQSVSDLSDFHRFVGDKVNNGGASLSPEDVLDEWRMLHPENEEDIAAIQEAIDDLDNGETGVSFAEFDRDFRARRDLAPKS